jgi:hypothetical protein
MIVKSTTTATYLREGKYFVLQGWDGARKLEPPRAILIDGDRVYPVYPSDKKPNQWNEKTVPAFISIATLPWRSGGGVFEHLLHGEDCPSHSVMLIHAPSKDVRVMSLVSLENARKPQNLKARLIDIVVGDRGVKRNLATESHGDMFDLEPGRGYIPWTYGMAAAVMD